MAAVKRLHVAHCSTVYILWVFFAIIGSILGFFKIYVSFTDE